MNNEDKIRHYQADLRKWVIITDDRRQLFEAAQREARKIQKVIEELKLGKK